MKSRLQRLLPVAIAISAVGCDTAGEGDEIKTVVDSQIKATMFEPSDGPRPVPPRMKAEASFAPYDTPPKPVGGMQAIRDALTYPEGAKEDGISGTVIVQAFIESSGTTGDAVVLSGVRSDLDDAALAAVRKIRWAPAEQKGEPVGVWISIPISFQPR